MSDVLSGLDVLGNSSVLLTIVLGVVLGFICGALPGFGSANAAAIALPFTLGLPLAHALTLFISVYAGSQYGGAIPAILVNVPGEPGAAATAMDGYPLTQQGRAQLAISVARMSSAVGGLGGMLVVIFVIGPMGHIALKFGSRELFLVAALGLAMIVSLVREDKRKGAVAGLLGLLIATMPANVQTGQPRLTFGLIQLSSQIPFVPALIGLFAFSQMFTIAGNRRLETQGNAATAIKPGRQILSLATESREGILTTFKYPFTILRSLFIGLVFGIVPGGGAATANFLSYGVAKRSSKHPEKFGTGTPEGIVASEVADNAVAGGTLIPTMTLGIPGTGTAAVMLACLILHGVQIGPQVMQTQGPAVYATLFALMLASLLILPLGILLAAPLSLITRLRPGYLVPTIITLAMVGVYAGENSLFDVGVALVFGVLGFLMRLGGYPVVPMIMALILGPIAEENFLRSLSLGNNSLGYFFESPIAIVLWALVAIALLTNISGRFRVRRRPRPKPAMEKELTPSERN